MMSFRFCNTKITLRFGFFAVPAIVLCLGGDEHFLPAILAVALHETGHILAAYLCGMEISEICFGALGIHMSGNVATISYLRRMLISLAGPLAGGIGFVLCLPLPREYYAMQLILFVFHILPAVPLDGGMALYCALCTFMPQSRAEVYITSISVLLAFLLGILGFSVLLRTKGNFTLLVTAMYILFYVIMKRRGDLC